MKDTSQLENHRYGDQSITPAEKIRGLMDFGLVKDEQEGYLFLVDAGEITEHEDWMVD